MPTHVRVVLAHGCFDLLHLGHIRHLQEARGLGDMLVVSVTADPRVDKGSGRPHFTAEQRVEALMALSCVDHAFINHSGEAVDAINRVRPAIYVKGIDYADRAAVDDGGALEREIAAVEAVGGKFVATRTEKWSSSRLINGQKYPDETLRYLDSARKRGFADKIKQAFAKTDAMHICFVGETIIDEYVYVRGLARPPKEFMLSACKTGRTEFKGGVIAAAMHGEWKNNQVVTMPRAVRKTRFVEQDFSRKLFEVYSRADLAPYPDEIADMARELIAARTRADAIIVFDFGHGMLTEGEHALLKGAKFLAVNVQTNAGNFGFNLAGKCRAAKPHLICLDEPEARLALADQRSVLDQAFLGRLTELCQARWPIVTRGKFGCRVGGAFDGSIDVPPFATAPALDTMGAGDAFLAVAGPLAAAGLELEACALAGNVAGAIKCQVLGHSRHVSRPELMQTIEALLA